jgi:hypothetical protein
VVRIPSLAGRSNATATTDENGDGVVDARDDAIATEKIDDRTERRLVRGRRDGTADVAEPVTEQPTEYLVNDRAAGTVSDPATTGHIPVVATPVTERTVDDEVDETPVVRGPRARASLFATLGLFVGVVAAATVLTGVLADFGLALGVVGALLSLGGFAATSRRHVAGRFDAILGFVLSLAAVVVGILAVTDNLSWLSLDTDTIPQFHTWLHDQWHNLTN